MRQRRPAMLGGANFDGPERSPAADRSRGTVAASLGGDCFRLGNRHNRHRRIAGSQRVPLHTFPCAAWPSLTVKGHQLGEVKFLGAVSLDQQGRDGGDAMTVKSIAARRATAGP